MKKITRNILIALLIMSTLGLMAFTPAIWPQAATAAAATPKPQVGQQLEKTMALNLQREQNVLAREQLHLTRAAQVATTAQNLITKAQAKGVNVDDLVTALADFNAKVATAQKSHDQAASILDAKNGFDASGNVTDRNAAHQTLVSGRNALVQTHLTLANAVISLRQAVLNWRIKNEKNK